MLKNPSNESVEMQTIKHLLEIRNSNFFGGGIQIQNIMSKWVNGYVLYGKRLKREICFKRNENFFLCRNSTKIHLFNERSEFNN